MNTFTVDNAQVGEVMPYVSDGQTYNLTVVKVWRLPLLGQTVATAKGVINGKWVIVSRCDAGCMNVTWECPDE